MSLLFLPLDSRPVTYNLPYELALANNLDIKIPPLNIMDNYKSFSNYQNIANWLLDNVKNCEYAIISIDQLVYGGLIASREQFIDLDVAINRLKTLAELKNLNPNIKIYCTNTIMRTTISTLKKEDEIYWQKVADYSKATSSNPELAEKLKKEIPEELINKFLNLRLRNHNINLEVINYLKEGIIDKLIFSQEDSAPEGMHKKEQEILIDKATKDNVLDKLFMMNGTDEVGATLIGYLINNKPKNTFIHFNNPLDKFVALFEDRPFIENINRYFALCNFKSSEINDTDMVLSIYVAKDKQGDYCGSYLSEKDNKENLDKYLNELSTFISNDKKVYILDIYDANGGNYNLIKNLYDNRLLDKISGYSGWNTACNSLGFLLAEMCCNKKNKKLIYYHILDDVFYQAIVRSKLQKELLKDNIDHWNLDNHYEYVEKLLNQYMHEEVHKLDSLNIFPEFEAKLRWARTFECYIDIK